MASQKKIKSGTTPTGFTVIMLHIPRNAESFSSLSRMCRNDVHLNAMHQTSIKKKIRITLTVKWVFMRTINLCSMGKVVTPNPALYILYYGKNNIYRDTHSTRSHNRAFFFLFFFYRAFSCVLYVNLFSFDLHGKKIYYIPAISKRNWTCV